MQLCKRLIITSSLLAVLAISSAYGATPVQASESTDTAVVEMDYSSIPELKNLSKAQHQLWYNLRLMLLREKLLTANPSIRQSLCLVTVLYP